MAYLIACYKIRRYIMSLQLPLNIQFEAYATFEHWVVGANGLATSLCQAMLTPNADKQLVLWGGSGVGKSHLLQATCARGAQQQLRTWYGPMADMLEFGSASLTGLDSLDVLCLDDLHRCAGQKDWEEALFGLINACRDSGCKLVLSMHNTPQAVGFKLPDLISRLGWGAVIELQELSGHEKGAWLQSQAKHQGYNMPDAVMNYLLAHYPRSMRALADAFETINTASIAQQRKLTVPFIKDVLG